MINELLEQKIGNVGLKKEETQRGETEDVQGNGHLQRVDKEEL